MPGFRASEILALDTSRLRPGGWDPLGLSTWDTSCGGLAEGGSIGDITVPVHAEMSPIWALSGPLTDRIEIWLLDLDHKTPDAGALPNVLFELRQGAGFVTTTCVVGTILPSLVSPPQGRILQVSGVLATQWELWARVAPGATPGIAPLTTRWRCFLDRTGTPPVASTDAVGDWPMSIPHIVRGAFVTITTVT
jgi:hypothetical protein